MRTAAILLLVSLAPAFSQKARVEGRVTDLAGQPLAKATVRMAMVTAPEGYETPPIYVSSSDSIGNFAFEDLAPVRYSLSVDRVGYVRYGPLNRTIDLAPGQVTSNLTIKLTREALISGKITDEDGDPYPNAQLSMCRWIFSNGRKQQGCGYSVVSGPDGSFVIGGLVAGRYYLSSQQHRLDFERELPGRKGPEETYVTTYYPGVEDLSAASPIDLVPGAQVRGLDFRLRKAQVFRIAGKALANNSNVSLLGKGQGENTRRIAPQTTDGVFEVNELLPGSYLVLANARPDLFGRQTVTIGNASVEDVIIQLAPAAELPVKIHSEDSGSNSLGAQLTLTNTEESGVSPTTQTRPDGTMFFRSVPPGIYRINLTPSTEGTYAKSIRFGDQDVTTKPLDLTSGTGGTLEVILSPHAADVNGRTTPGLTVSLWNGPDYVRTTVADGNGAFRFTNLPPSEYHMAAWEKIDQGIAEFPEFLFQFETRATPVKLGENAHENTDPVIIRSDAIEVEANKLR